MKRRTKMLLGAAALCAGWALAPTTRDALFSVAVAAGMVGIWTAYHEPKNRGGRPRKPKAPPPDPGEPLFKPEGTHAPQ